MDSLLSKLRERLGADPQSAADPREDVTELRGAILSMIAGGSGGTTGSSRGSVVQCPGGSVITTYPNGSSTTVCYPANTGSINVSVGRGPIGGSIGGSWSVPAPLPTRPPPPPPSGSTGKPK